MASGHFFTLDKEEAVIGFYQYCPDNINNVSDTVSFSLIPIEVNTPLTEISAGLPVVQKQEIIPFDCRYGRKSTLVGKDLNNDGIDEILSAFSYSGSEPRQTFKIYQGQEPLNLSLWADLDALANKFYASIAVGDIRTDTLEIEPIMEMLVPIQADHGNSWIYQIKVDPTGEFQEAALLHKSQYLPTGNIEPVQIADFDGDIRLGSPRRFSVTEILQPLVILNAPPIHFDIFDEQPYDVSLSYNENEGQFISSYVKESSQFAEVQTEINKDWALSKSVSAGFSFWGVSVSSHFSQTYGDKFSKISGSSTKVTVGISVDAKEDDRIYAMVMDYNIWEYPIYVNKLLKGHILVVEPLASENRWFPSKSWSGYSYIPTHEVGNILSYREYTLLSNNPLLDEKIKGDYNDSFVLDATSSYDWQLAFEDFETNESSTTKEYTRDWGASVSAWGSGFSINGTYHSEDISTQRTEVATGLNIGVHLDEIDMSIGEVGYIVTPYAYWSNNGALVIDYAVKPEISAPGGTPTWWQVHYDSLADPAFILPWRYDPEKGYTLEEEAKRYQTKDLLFYPPDPKEGDVITIEARVHNFSLMATPSPMGVRFYIGDPDDGGVLITGVGDISEVFTDAAIPARETKTVQMNWEIPNGLGTFPRIYAAIDAQDELEEIHENNNKCWAVLQKSTATGIVGDDRDIVPSEFKLNQNYPNPFNPSTVIQYELPITNYVELSIYNLLGQKVVTLVSKRLPAGSHQVEWNARDFASGVYHYRLNAGKFQDVKKMVLLR